MMATVHSLGAPARDSLAVVESEAALLGALMIDNRIVDRVANILTAEDFYEQLHGRIFTAIEREVSAGRGANPVLLRGYFTDDPALKDVGPGYLAELTGSSAALIGAMDFARQIADFAKRRRLRDAMQAVLAEVSTPSDQPVEELVAQLDATLADSLQQHSSVKSLSLAKAFDEALELIRQEAAGEISKGVEIAGLDDWNHLTGGMRAGEVTIIGARPGMGKAQPIDAPVLTLGGWREMGSLRIGDQIASPDGRPSQVVGIYPQGAKQIWRVTFSDGRSAECCDEHLWRVHHRQWNSPRVLPLADIRKLLAAKRNVRRLSVDLFEGDFGTDEALPLDPWMLGFLLGDGAICGGQVRFSTTDPEVLERLAAVLPAGLSISHQGRCDYRITGGQNGGRPNAVMDALRELGVFECRSAEKFVPDLYKRQSSAIRLELLRGLMDADGWAETFGAVRFATASERLAHDVQWLVRSLGGLCSVASKRPSHRYLGETRAGKISFVCRIRHPHGQKLFGLARKAERARRGRNASVRLNIVSIELSRIADAQCIKVSHPNQLYVTTDFVVTHNTAVALSVATGAARNGHGTLLVSLEMRTEELVKRSIADLLWDFDERAPHFEHVKKGYFNDLDKKIIEGVRARIVDWPLILTDPSKLKIGRLAMSIRRYQRQLAAKGQKLELVVLDYLGLIKPDQRGAGRYESVGEISRTIKEVAKECGVHIAMLAQLNRECEKREDKRPQLSDLRDSGDIEQDADNIIFLFREEYYLEKMEPPKDDKKRAEWEEQMSFARDRLEIIAAKRRNGKTGKRVCWFFADRQAVRGSSFSRAQMRFSEGLE